MSAGSSHVNKFEITESMIEKSKNWQNSYMYKTSYLKECEKNPSAIKNSTLHLLNTRSSSLRAISSRSGFINKQIDNSDFLNYDYNNLYRTSYTDMSTKLTNTHFIPNYKGFVPGLNSENAFGKNFTELTKENSEYFNKRRFNTLNSNHEKIWQYNPVSKTTGNFWRNKTRSDFKNSLRNHEHTAKIKNSGYDTNHNTFDKTGWVPHPSLHSDMERTEYRIQYNRKKDVH